MLDCRKVVLGTAQLGMNYGVANTAGMPSLQTALEIVETAWQGGVRLIDTAPAYGQSELVLGQCLKTLSIGAEVQVLTKLGECSPDSVRKELTSSMNRLGVKRLHGVMLHRQEDLGLIDSGLGDAIAALKKEGLVGGFGISVYDPQIAIEALSRDDIDMVQIPANLLDRRFEQKGVSELAAKLGKTLYVRSVYLQGLLLMEPGAVPEYLARAVPIVQAVETLACELELTRVQLALAYVRAANPEAMVLIGAERVSQISEGLEAFRINYADLVGIVQDRFPESDETIVNPSKWVV